MKRLFAFILFWLIAQTAFATSPVFYSVSAFDTGTLETGAGNITITSGVATLGVEQTGNIGAGCDIEYNSLHAYIAPNRIGFDVGKYEIESGDKIEDGTTSGTGIVRYVEITGGSWAGNDTAGWIYFESTDGSAFGNNNSINITKPTSQNGAATIDGTIEGNIGNGNTEFVVKSAIGADAANQASCAVTSIHHEWQYLSEFEGAFTDANHINDGNLTGADVVAFACCYYDHIGSPGDADTTAVTIDFGTTGADNYLQVYTPVGGAESINVQRHDGKWNTGKYRLEVHASSYAVYIQEEFVRVFGLQTTNTDSQDKNFTVDVASAGETHIGYCIVKGNTNTGRGIQSYNNVAGHKNYIYNNIVYGTYYGIQVHASVATAYNAYIYNNTCIDNSVNFRLERADNELRVKNNITQGAGTGYSIYQLGGSVVTEYVDNLSEDATSPNNEHDSKVVDFVDEAGDDFHLDSTDTDAKDQGTDLSSDSNLSFSDDIDGNERGASWDIGADEYVSGAPAATAAQFIGIY